MMLSITVVWTEASGQWFEKPCTLPPGATVADALSHAGRSVERLAGTEVGVWGRKAPLSQPLRDRDRVECYRPLKVDPKVARKERFGRQGARAAGLFARRRPGGKPGY